MSRAALLALDASKIKKTPNFEEKAMLQKAHGVSDKSGTQVSMSVETNRESAVHYRMKSECLLKRKEYHTTAWVDSAVTKLGLLVEIPELGGLWEVVEIYPYRLSDKQLKTHRISTVTLVPQLNRKLDLSNRRVIRGGFGQC
jgi:hypothetical protein